MGNSVVLRVMFRSLVNWVFEYATAVDTVLNAALLALTELGQPVTLVKAMEVIFTTLALPALDKVLVVKVPVPLAKVIVAVVEATVLVPLTL